MRNTWVICLEAWDNQPKGWLIPDKPTGSSEPEGKGGLCIQAITSDEPAAHQLVGGVMAHQGNDG